MDQERYELIRRIASVVGHELRNPLAVINNSAYFVKTKLGSAKDRDPKVEKHLGIIAAEISRADRLIADMLAFSRPLEPKLEPVDLRAMADEALKACVLPDHIKVKREGPKVKIMVLADARVLTDALRRIIDNAIEALPGAGSITVAVGAGDDAAFAEVRDTGPGFKAEIRD